MILPSIQIFFCEKYHLSSSENINNNLKLRLANNLMKCESLGITSGTLKHQYLHGMSQNKLVNLTAKVNFRQKFRVDLLPFLNVTLSIKRMFSNKPQLGLPKHYSFDIYIR